MSLWDRLVRALYRHRDDYVLRLEAERRVANGVIEEQAVQLGRQTARIEFAAQILADLSRTTADANRAALRVLTGDGDSRG